jgi:hypothetical protein
MLRQALLTTSQAMMPWYHPTIVPYPTLWMTSLWTQFGITALPQTADASGNCHLISKERLTTMVYPTLRITSMKLASLGRVCQITQIGSASNLIFRSFGDPTSFVECKHQWLELDIHQHTLAVLRRASNI